MHDSYEPAIELAGARTVHLPLSHGLLRRLQRVADAINARSRMIIINSPHNPTGATLSSAIWTRSRRCFGTPRSACSRTCTNTHLRRPRACQRGIQARGTQLLVSSFGKTYHVTGWKIGYCVAPRALSPSSGVHQYLTFCVQCRAVALADYMQRADTIKAASLLPGEA
jgi:methionine aminotransferase